MQFRFRGIFRDYINRRLRVAAPDEIRLGREDFEGLYNPYYAKLSYAFGISSLAASAVLVLFILGAVLLNLRSVTYENLYYFFKDFDSVVSSDEFMPDGVNYGYEENRSFAPYKGGFVRAGSNSISVFSATGRKTKTFYDGYTNPVIKTSERYIIAYDAGGRELSVYNSFARLFTESFEEPILAVEVCDEGAFAVLTTDGSGTAVYRYSSGFDAVAIYPYPDFITAISLSPDGENLAVSYADTDGETLMSITEIFEGLTEEPAYTASGSDGMALLCDVTDTPTFSGRVGCALVSSGGASVFTSDGAAAEISLGRDERIIGASTDDGGLALAVSDDGGYLLHVLTYGEEPFGIRLDTKPVKIIKNENFIYVLASASLTRYNITTGTLLSLSLTAGAEDIILSEGGYIFVCYPSRAVSVAFE